MLFKEVVLLTSKIDEMKDFYKNTLGLEVVKEDSEFFIAKIGLTKLKYKKSASGTEPFYHFAINIPENKFAEAKSWIKSIVSLNLEEGDDEVYFGNWNAHAIYFEDPSGNIIELIARHNLGNGTNHSFTPKDLLNISEIGIVVDDVIPFVKRLNALGIPNWRDDSPGLTPVGDENGLFITVKSGRTWYFSNKDAEFFPVEVSIDGGGNYSFTKNNSEVLINEGINI